MSDRRTGTPNTPSAPDADDRIPFPRTDRAPACRNDPKAFAIEDIDGRAEREKALTKARLACSGCPIVKGWLQWALASKQLTLTGVWAATTARQRTLLRKDLVRRLGEDWVGVVVAQERRKQEKQHADPHGTADRPRTGHGTAGAGTHLQGLGPVRAVARADDPSPPGTQPPNPRSSSEGGGMTFTDSLVLDGFLDEPTMPGDNTTARFRLTISPTHDGTDEMVLPCSVADPVMAAVVLHGLAPGDQLRVTGYLHLPRTPTDPMFLAVTELYVLQSALLLGAPDTPSLAARRHQ
ncbi:WhiB family transcriptional regulator [Streptomyces caniferus]|uniref:WhiB family transcriptional regulator n=1 Tax=Streptomyces caniferus TaxID=285557 RepID=UPI00380EBF79